tara:strand:- start:597 stop:815 length:219 start_codon:yes stop_codon:yes gene_type:complete
MIKERYLEQEINKDLRILELKRQLEEAREIVKAVAHIGIDWGYGKFELNQDHIDKARKLYEEHEQLKEQGDE